MDIRGGKNLSWKLDKEVVVYVFKYLMATSFFNRTYIIISPFFPSKYINAFNIFFDGYNQVIL